MSVLLTLIGFSCPTVVSMRAQVLMQVQAMSELRPEDKYRSLRDGPAAHPQSGRLLGVPLLFHHVAIS